MRMHHSCTADLIIYLFIYSTIFFTFRQCFVTCEQIGHTKAVRNTINRTLSPQGGVFWEGIKDSQLSEYCIRVLDEYLKQRIENQNRKKAALTLGRNGQEGEEVYILSEEVKV